jgi:hypothetical protein
MLVSSPDANENLKMIYNNEINTSPKNIKTGWYNERRIIPNMICKRAVEKSINNFDAPF